MLLHDGPLDGAVREVQFLHFMPILYGFDDDDFNSHRYWLGAREDGSWHGFYQGEQLCLNL